MTEKEYLDIIKKLRKKLNKQNAKDIINKLDNISNIKPIRSQWFVAKAEALQVDDFEGNYLDVIKLLSDKSWALYNYDEVIDLFNVYLKYSEHFKNEWDIRRLKYAIACIYNTEENPSKEYQETINNELLNFYKVLNDFLDLDELNEEILVKVMKVCYIKQNFVSYLIFDYLYQILFEKPSMFRKWCQSMPNLGYLKERLESNVNDTFILIVSDEYDIIECEAIAVALGMLGKKVFLIDIPQEIEVDNNINLEDTLQTTIDNIEEYQYFTVFHSIKVIYDGKILGDNKEFIVDYINQNYALDNLSTVISSGFTMDELAQRKLMKKQLERLFDFQADYYEDNMVFGWSGNYLSYISQIYGFDTQEAINRESECDFSIVIPARNSAFTLRHTIQTCLDINYNGSYEIVISDNSTNGNQDVFNLIHELNDDRIKYYKTPRDLHLPKSFEFAFLKARGEFIFSIGSDDGVLPWCLEVLSQVLKKYPNEEIIKWQRGFYAWPKFNYTQENQFTVPTNCKKGELNISYVTSSEYLGFIAKSPQMMYILPMLYINSGFRRSYFKTLVNKTGRLLDGICQDIYMGVINILINKQILTLSYPLTIAGMANGSVGQTSNEAKKSVEEANKDMADTKKSNNIGGFSKSWTERLFPELKSDVSSLYNCLLRAVARGIMPIEYIDEIFTWEKMYENCIKLMYKDDIFYDKNVHYMRYTVTKHGETLLKIFDKQIYPKLMEPYIIEDTGNKGEEPDSQQNQNEKQRCYKIGFKNQELTLDASEFGVQNINDAVKLFSKLTGL